MAGWVKVVLFLMGGVAAAGGTAYVTGLLDPWLAPKPAVVAPAPQQQEPAAAGQEAEAAAEADVGTEAGEPATTPKQDRLAAPVFDLLRVEPDGSVLIAGKSSPQAVVEVLSGETVLGRASAGAGGDFVVTLDDPLAPGDYRMALRATGPGKEAVLSTGTAIVSIPGTKDGQVLAMVEEPGAAAQLIAVPQAPEPAVVAEEAAEAEAVTAAPEAAPAAVDETEEPAAPAVAETGAAPEPAAGEAGQEETASQDEASAGGEVAEVPADEEAAKTPVGEAPAALPSGEPAAPHVVAVEAVEIEGDTIFVAGRADAGGTVRVYAGTVLLGDAVASKGGRFLVEATRRLEVGNHMIRADLLGADGSVVARAAVPFEREPGESIAAVAPAVPAAPEEPAAAASPQDRPAEAAPAEEADAGAQSAETAAPAEAQARVEDEADVAADAPGAGEDEATAPPLQRADGAVIIRRGDSLWRISRRVYGHGIRYSTIYLANQDQIRDPDRIWPGQVFAVPNETPEGEQADLDAIGEQAVKPERGPAAQ